MSIKREGVHRSKISYPSDSDVQVVLKSTTSTIHLSNFPNFNFHNNLVVVFYLYYQLSDFHETIFKEERVKGNTRTHFDVSDSCGMMESQF